MTTDFMSKAAFARLADVSSATATRLSQGRLKSAVSGGKIDAAHPDCLNYIAEREARQTVLPPAAPGIPSPMDKGHVRGPIAAKETSKRLAMEKLVTGGKTIHHMPDDVTDFGRMTLNEITARFGTDVAFVDWLKATKSIEDINEKRLKNEVTQGELVSRELVRVGIIEVIEAAHLKLLSDGAKTIARRTMAMAAAGRSLDEVEAFVVDNIASHIRPVKARTRKALKNA